MPIPPIEGIEADLAAGVFMAVTASSPPGEEKAFFVSEPGRFMASRKASSPSRATTLAGSTDAARW